MKKNVKDSSNHRPVMQSSCLLKVYELHISDVLPKNQPLNKKSHSKTDATTIDPFYVSKETMSKY